MSENDPDRITGWVPPSVEPPPANPPLFYTDDEHQPDPIMHTAITLWDIYFGMAMNGELSWQSDRSHWKNDKRELIEWCSDVATAMLAERAKREGS